MSNTVRNSTLLQIPRSLQKFLLDLVLIALAYTLALLLDENLTISERFFERLQLTFPYVVGAQAMVFVFSNLYSSIWRYASLQDVVEITKAVTLAVIMTAMGMLFVRDTLVFYRVLLVLDWGVLMALMLGSRFAFRYYRERIISLMHQGQRRQSAGRPTLIVGAGDAGNLLIREISKQTSPDVKVIGFVDDDPHKQGLALGGFKVLGTTAHLPKLMNRYGIEEVIIAIPSAPAQTIRKVVTCCRRSGVRFRTLPGIQSLIDGSVLVSQLRDVAIEDLLGRQPVQLEGQAISRYLAGKRVLVTGAAGSIGSELCRQVCRYAPAKLLLVDSAETPLYQVEKELTELFPELRIIPIIADVRHKQRIEALFDSFLPQVVFHAAAYKHVPMMEYNPTEAVSNNLGGTIVLADAAHGCGVEHFVMISTDKAVHPTNVMGASKRAAELYVQTLAHQKSRTCFTTVRFGNVLGSNGSVIPLFKEQIKAGGPLTVTDARVVRYFMTIPEACQLVLQAGCLGTGGDIFVLDMGEPVRILDLAEELIRLSGFVPYEDIQIEFTGLRPGEKLYEELLIEGEGIKPTCHEKIRVTSAVRLDPDATRAQLMALLETAAAFDTGALLQQLQVTVPEFNPQYHFEGEPPFAFRRLRPDVQSERAA